MATDTAAINERMTAFERSQEDIAAGRVYRAGDAKDLMAAIYAD